MPRRPDPERLRHAKLAGASMAVRDQVHVAPAELVERHRSEWPELWERLDQLLELADQ